MKTSRGKGERRMVRIGDHARCPQCHKNGRVVWVSQDGRQMGIQCQTLHTEWNRGPSKFGSNARPQTKPKKGMVFLVQIQ